MSSRVALASALMLSLALLITPLLVVHDTAKAAPIGAYSERLDVYTAGSTAYWTATFSGLNLTKPAITAAEGVSGLNSYQLTAVQTTSGTSSGQLFWQRSGYGVLNIPFVPDQGVFLELNASTPSAAQGAVTAFDRYLGLSLSQVSTNGSLYTYFSTADFALAGQIMFEAVPTQYGGLAALYAEPNFATLPSPVIAIAGAKGTATAFTHSVTIGSMSTGVLSSAGLLSMTSVISGTNASLTSSPDVNSTKVVIHSLDGIIVSSDSAARLVNHETNFSGSYSLSVPSTKPIKPNVTLVSDTPTLTAYRVIGQNEGVLSSGDLLTVTIQMRDTSQSGTIQNITMNDNWWNSYPNLFQLSAGNSSVNVASLGPGQNISQTYVLKVIGSDSHDIFLPSSTLAYAYTSHGAKYHRTTTLNQLEVRTNNQGPALSIQAGLNVLSGSPVGRSASYLVTVTNNGNAPALSLSANGSSLQSLAPNGGQWKFNTSIIASNLRDRNISKTFTLTWTTPDGTKGSLSSNVASVVFSHTGAVLPFVQFSLAGTFTPTVLASGTANVTYSLANKGTGTATGVDLSQTLPAGVSCTPGSVTGPVSCSSSALTMSNQSIAGNANLNGTFTLTFPKDNLVIPAANVNASAASGIMISSKSGALVIPAGIYVSKTFMTNPAFQGMTDNVNVQVSNVGSSPVYNLSASSSSDVFDSAATGSNQTQKFFQQLDGKTNQSFGYSVNLITSGNHTVGTVSLTFIFSGFGASYSVPQNVMVVYPPLQVTGTTTPSPPTEGSPFSLDLSVSNPAPVNVTSVTLTVSVPVGVQLVNSTGLQVHGNTATLTLPSLAGRGKSVNSLTLKASSGLDLNFNANLTFMYQGQTIHGANNIPTTSVGVDVLTRYEFPVALAILLLLVAAVYIHRKVTVAPRTTRAGPNR